MSNIGTAKKKTLDLQVSIFGLHTKMHDGQEWETKLAGWLHVRKKHHFDEMFGIKSVCGVYRIAVIEPGDCK